MFNQSLIKKGFSLIELLMMIAVVSSLCLWSISSLTDILAHYKARILVKKLEHILRFSRHTAVALNHDMLLKPLIAEDWSEGVALLLDTPNHDLSAEKTPVLYRWSWSHPMVNLQWQGFQSKQYIIFAKNLSQSASNGQFMIRYRHQVLAKIILNRLGRVKKVE